MPPGTIDPQVGLIGREGHRDRLGTKKSMRMQKLGKKNRETSAARNKILDGKIDSDRSVNQNHRRCLIHSGTQTDNNIVQQASGWGISRNNMYIDGHKRCVQCTTRHCDATHTATTKSTLLERGVLSTKHENAAPKSHRSRPKSSPSPALYDGLKVLDPLQSCKQAGESSSRCF